ncbi:MAG: hypothetical protein MK137_09460, partial [Rickettsiales bacterium]|nr:hypothetical protein [Rickettsiales bacterium]
DYIEIINKINNQTHNLTIYITLFFHADVEDNNLPVSYLKIRVFFISDENNNANHNQLFHPLLY